MLKILFFSVCKSRPRLPLPLFSSTYEVNLWYCSVNDLRRREAVKKLKVATSHLVVCASIHLPFLIPIPFPSLLTVSSFLSLVLC